MKFLSILLLLFFSANLSLSNGDLLTQTIYGFLDFTTTIGNTVMIFSPQSAPPAPVFKPEVVTTTAAPIIKTKPAINVVTTSEPESVISPTKLKSSSKPSEEVKPVIVTSESKPEAAKTLAVTVAAAAAAAATTTAKTTTTSSSSTTTNAIKTATSSSSSSPFSASTTSSTSLSSSSLTSPPSSSSAPPSSSSSFPTSSAGIDKKTQAATTPSAEKIPASSTSLLIENDLYSPEYDLLSRQPPQYVEESFRVVNLKSNTQNGKNQRPAVVVTPEKNSVSSVLASKASTSSAAAGLRPHKNKKNKIRPSTTLQVLKTAAPVVPVIKSSGKTSSYRSSAASAPAAAASSFSPTSTGSSRKSSKKNRNGSTTTTQKPEEEVVIVRSTSSARSKPKRKNKHNKNASASSSASKPRYSNPPTTTSTTEATVRRVFRPKVQSPANSDLDHNNLHITKLNRAPGRWQYKTSPKPRVTIRKPSIDVNGPLGLANVTSVAAITDPTLTTLNDNINNNFLVFNQSDLDSSGSQNGNVLNNIDLEGTQKFFTETINVEISTPADFKDTYYEIATIKKPFIFQAGVLKKTRYITVTSTIEKYLTAEPSVEPRNADEPLTENILATTSKPEDNGELLGSISTLAPIFVSADLDTPVLETVTESFSIVNKKLKTQVLPIVYGLNEHENDTSYATLVQTIDMTSLITVTKTISPQMETTKEDFNGFKDFVGNLDEAGSEINLDLEFGDEGNQENSSHETQRDKDFVDGLLIGGNRSNKTAKPSASKLLPTLLPTETQNPLLQTLPTPNIITNSKAVVKLETLWDTYVVPITNGQSTSYRTLSKAKGVVEKTDYILETTTVPAAPPSQLLQPSTLNPFLLPLQQQQFQTITSPVVQQTIVTQTESKILKLTFGARTAYTTIFSTHIVPTLQTMYVTTSVPVQPTAANPFPGYFPQPYNPFAYLG